MSSASKSWLLSEPWKNEDVYIIGGGPSLANFNLELLKSKNTIGCNDAYKFGHEIVKVCIFGDYSWWKHHEDNLQKYEGILVSNACKFSAKCPLRINYFRRVPDGLITDKRQLAWNGNTGMSALNLALHMGASRVFLLGFDMGIVKGKTNWHNEIIHPNAVLPSSYKMFLNHVPAVVRDLKQYFSDRQVINVNEHETIPGIKHVRDIL